MSRVAYLEVENLTVDYDRPAPVVDAISFTVSKGEFLTFIGRSGSGKTTILRAIAGLAQTSGGAVTWLNGEAPRLSFVFQEASLLPWKDALHNVTLPLEIAGVRGAEAAKRAEGALIRVGLRDRMRAMPGELSGGERMRVSIARALVAKPQVMLMDEPFGALDEITRMRLNEILLELASAEGWTVLFVTHSVFEAAYLSDKVAILTAEGGKLAALRDIPLPRPRRPSVRGTAAYAHQCAGLSDVLRDQVSPAAEIGL